MLDALKQLACMRGTITTTHAFIAASFIAHAHDDDETRKSRFIDWLIDAGADELAAHRFLKNQGAVAFGAKTRWRFKRETIVEKLAVTAGELRDLSALQPADIKQKMRQERERKERDRRAAGVISRAEYRGPAAARYEQILRLAAQDLSAAAIAAAMGLNNEGAARTLLYRARADAKKRHRAEQHAVALRLHAAGCLPGRIAEELDVTEKKAATILKAALKTAGKGSKSRAS